MKLDGGFGFLSTLLGAANEANQEGIIFGMTAAQIASLVFTWVLYALIMYKLFQKADHPEPMRAFVPFLNFYEAFKLVGGNGLFCILLFIPVGIVQLIGQVMLAVYVGRAFRKSTIYKLGMFFFPVLFYGFLALSSGDRFWGINGYGHTPAEPGSINVDFETTANHGPAQAEPVHHETVYAEPVVSAEDITPVAEPVVTDVEEADITIE